MILLIDIQNEFLEFHKNKKEYIDNITNYVLNSNEAFAIIVDDMGDSSNLLMDLLSVKIPAFTCSKNFGFLLGSSLDHDELIKIGKFIIHHKIDSRIDSDYFGISGLFLPENKDFLIQFKIDFPTFEKYINASVIIPKNLVLSLHQIQGEKIRLVGGRETRCIKEIKLLLDILSIESEIISDLCYN